MRMEEIGWRDWGKTDECRNEEAETGRVAKLQKGKVD